MVPRLTVNETEELTPLRKVIILALLVLMSWGVLVGLGWIVLEVVEWLT